MHKKELLKILVDLVEINSYTQNIEGVNKVIDYIEGLDLEFLQKIKTKRIRGQDSGDLLIWETKNNSKKKPKVLLSTHIDTVHPPELAFRYSKDGNIIKGPGTLDLKGAIVIIIQTLESLFKLNKLENLAVTFIPDEETGSQHHKQFLNQYYKNFDYALVFEDGGKFYPKQYKPNYRKVILSRKGLSKYTVISEGQGGHAGTLDKKKDRVSAVHDMMRFLNEALKLDDYSQKTTINAGTIQGGTTFNTIAEKCRAEIDVRFTQTTESKRIRKQLQNLIKVFNNKKTSKFILKEDIFIPPFECTPEVVSFYKKVRKIGVELGLKIEKEERGGGSDANQISHQGVVTLDGFGPCGHDDHTIREFIYFDSIISATKLAQATIQYIMK